MKKSLFLLPLAAMLATACSSNEPLADNNSDQTPVVKFDGEAKYLTMNLVQAGKTRADLNEDPTYKDGTENENNINLIRFYFFYNDGSPCTVRVNPSNEEQYLSYIDWNPNSSNDITGDIPTTPQTPSSETVEKIVSASIMITGEEGKEAPNLVVAVLNPTSDIMSLTGVKGNLSLNDLSNLDNYTIGIADYYTGLYNNNFVMSNSVYAQDNKTVNATALTEEMLANSLADSYENPVVIYVERVLARLDLSVTATQATGDGVAEGLYDTGATFGGEKVYVKILGWQVTSTPDKSRLVKEINPTWATGLFGDDELWNTPGYHRSYWAINPIFNQEYSNLYYTYNQVVNNGNKMPATSTAGNPVYTTVYMQENAANYESGDNISGEGPTYPTQILVVGQLVKADGTTPVEICEYLEQQYTTSDMLTYFAENSNLYWIDTANQNARTKMLPSDLTFKAMEQVTNQAGEEVDGQYTVYAVLSEQGEKKTWYEGSAQNAEPLANLAAVNSYLNLHYNFAKGSTMVWAKGMNYYYLTIEHLGAEGANGYYGVVRNHIYDTKITNIAGLGTPVYNPDLVIYPEENIKVKGLLAAQIRILQWRLVSTEYELNW